MLKGLGPNKLATWVFFIFTFPAIFLTGVGFPVLAILKRKEWTQSDNWIVFLLICIAQLLIAFLLLKIAKVLGKIVSNLWRSIFCWSMYYLASVLLCSVSVSAYLATLNSGNAAISVALSMMSLIVYFFFFWPWKLASQFGQQK